MTEQIEALELSKHYSYSVNWSPEDQVYVARVVEWPSLAAHAESPEDALRELRTVVAFCIEDCRENQEEFPEPLSDRKFSGKFSLRIPPELHRRLAIVAAREGVSLNRLVATRLAASL